MNNVINEKIIVEKMQRSREPGTISSLPFVIENNNIKAIRWFNFTVSENKTGTRAAIRVRSIFDMELDGSVTKNEGLKVIGVDIISKMAQKYDNYYHGMEKLIHEYNKKAMIELVKAATLQEIIPIYEELI